jgi:preprotein translocase subunit SecD
MDRTENADEVIPKVIDVLKRRIDPNGLFEISIVRQGQDRVEITMPLPRQGSSAAAGGLRGRVGQARGGVGGCRGV